MEALTEALKENGDWETRITTTLPDEVLEWIQRILPAREVMGSIHHVAATSTTPNQSTRATW